MKARSAVAISVGAIAVAVSPGRVRNPDSRNSKSGDNSLQRQHQHPDQQYCPAAADRTTRDDHRHTGPASNSDSKPPPVVVIPQAPVTVTQAPSTVYPYGGDPAPPSSAEQQVTSDHSTAESVVGWWIPQPSSNVVQRLHHFPVLGLLRDHDPPDILDGRSCKRLV